MKTRTRILLSVGLLGLVAGAMAGTFLHSSAMNQTKATETSADWNNTYTGTYSGTYYNGITAVQGASLQNQLHSLISNATDVGYDGLFDVYPDSDARPEDNTVFDMYGDIHFPLDSKRCGNQSAVGDCWNREHSIPKSWWGSNKNEKYSDAHHLLPTDGRINNWRSAYALGEVTKPKSDSTYSFVRDSSSGVYIQGTSTLGTDASGNTVFEPADCYKGDFARIYFYFATRYEGGATSGDGSKMFSTSQTNYYLTSAAKEMFLRWHEADPVSIKEVNRNNGVYLHQNNRNPFVDHPEYAEAIWENTPVSTDKVTLSASNLSFSVDSSATLTATSSDGSSISWVSSNTSVATVSSASSLSGAQITINPVSAGSATITASATINSNTVSASCSVVVTKVINSLYYEGNPTKTVYDEGESFDATGVAVYVKYTDNSIEDVTDSVSWSPSPLTLGTTSVTGTFGGKSIQINELTINPISEPFVIDSNTDLSTGDQVYIRTNESSPKGVTGLNGTNAGVSTTQTAWKKYQVKNATSSGFKLYDADAEQYIATPTSNTFGYSDDGGLCSTDSSGHLICNNRYLCVNGSNYRFYQNVQSTYSYFFIYKIPKNIKLVSIAVSGQTTSFTVGDDFAFGGTVTATYDDSSTANVTSGASFEGYDMDLAGDYTVDVSYTEGSVTATTSYDITVNSPAELLSISVSGTPTKKSYYAGESFDPTGLTVTAHYDNESSSTVTSSVTWTPNPLTIGTTSVTGTYEGKTCTVAGITVSEAPFVNSILECYSKAGQSSGDVYGLYVGTGDGQSPIIMNGEYGITLFKSGSTLPSWTAYETYVKVSGNVVNFNNLFEIDSYTATVIDGTSQEAINNIAPVSLYSVSGSESTSDLTVASRACVMTGYKTSSDISSGANASLTFHLDNGNDVNLYIKKAKCTADVASAINGSSSSNKITIKGFTNFYNSTFQIYLNEVLDSSATYTAAQFAQYLLTETNTICASSSNKAGELSGVWLDLQTNIWPLVSSSDRETLRTATANESGSTIEQAMARYDRICTKYSACANFINRSSANASNRMSSVIDNKTIIIAASISVFVAVSTITTYLFLKKKRKDY